jgi:hypothetical protein
MIEQKIKDNKKELISGKESRESSSSSLRKSGMVHTQTKFISMERLKLKMTRGKYKE